MTVFKQLLNDYKQCLIQGAHTDASAAYLALVAEYEQAARRAPAVPVPQKGWRYVPEVLTPEMKHEFMDMLMDGIDIYMNSNDQIEIQTDAPRRIWKSILAAAPQPPESAQSNSAEFDGIKTKAAPVQLPEPVAYLYHDAPTLEDYLANERAGIPINSACIGVKRMPHCRNETPLYTEQQVRELLATHGIEEPQ